MSESFSKQQRLRHRKEFLEIKSKGVTYYGSFLVVEKLQKEGPLARLGVTVTKKYGKSHDRALFKRRIREIFRKLKNLPSGLCISVKARAFAKKATYQQLEAELSLLCFKE